MKMKRRATKNAFTLIELLAVIVILAIIALIAVPVILNIIDTANKSAFKDSAYGIISAGELYFAEQQLEVNGMTEEEKNFELPAEQNTLGLKGNVPTGSMTITRDGKISLMVKNERYCVTKGLEEDDITITEEPENCTVPSGGSGNQGTGGSGQKTLADLITGTPTNNCVISGKCLETEIKSDTGIKVTINVKEGTPKDFYVLADDGEKIILMMSENLGDNVKWYDSLDNSHGPTKALEQLASLTYDWQIPEFTYQLSGKGENNGTQRYPDSEVTAKARLITYAEASAVGCTTSSGNCPDWMTANLTGSDIDSNGKTIYGYWTSTAYAGNSYDALSVTCNGTLYNHYTYYTDYGVRPVIELSK